jgi:hypothetical protein
MEGANQALSYIVFERDRERFERLFPDLEIVEQSWIANYPRYLLSGGLNFRQLLPTFRSRCSNSANSRLCRSVGSSPCITTSCYAVGSEPARLLQQPG